MIPAQITSDLALLSASVQAAAPIKAATPLRKAALVSAGLALVSEIDTGLAGAVGSLDAADPAGYAGDLVNALLGLATAAYDQATLADMRGTVGRAVFNLGVAIRHGTDEAIPKWASSCPSGNSGHSCSAGAHTGTGRCSANYPGSRSRFHSCV